VDGGDMVNNKIKGLITIAKQFNEAKITWNLGASCMLYLRTIVNDFNDIDIMISENDIDIVKEIMSKYSIVEKRDLHPKYKTKAFLEYNINGVDIDIMAGFIIIAKGVSHYFPLISNENNEIIIIDETQIYLESLETWLKYYKLMGRKDKTKLIINHMNRISITQKQ
jgi:hypothetical protein